MGPGDGTGLLTDAEFEEQLRLYVLGSFPLGWATAKEKILTDRRVRTKMMRAYTQEELQGISLDGSEDSHRAEVQELLDALREAHAALKRGPLKTKIGKLLKEY